MGKQADQSIVLSPRQARGVIALQFQRDEIVRQANRLVEEIMEASQEQGNMLALVHQLPRGDGVTYRFDTVDVDGKPRIKMTVIPTKTKEQEDGTNDQRPE